MISAWQNQTDRFLGFISLSVPWCEQREWSSRCAQIILQHRGPPPSIFRGLVVVRVSQSVIHAAGDGWFTHTHTNTPLHAPTSTPRRPISCRPAVKLCIYIMHEAESPERQQQSSSLRMFTPPCVCVCAWPCLGVQTWAPLRETVLFLPPATLQPIRDNKDEINKYWWL